MSKYTGHTPLPWTVECATPRAAGSTEYRINIAATTIQQELANMKLIEDAPVLLNYCNAATKALKDLVREVKRERAGEQFRFVALALEDAEVALLVLEEKLQ